MSAESTQVDVGAYVAYLRQLGFDVSLPAGFAPAPGFACAAPPTFALAPTPTFALAPPLAPAPSLAPALTPAPAPVFTPAPAPTPAPALTPTPALAPPSAFAPAPAPALVPAPIPSFASRFAPVLAREVAPVPVGAMPLAQAIPPRMLVAPLIPGPPSMNANPPPLSLQATRIRSHCLIGRRPTLTFTYLSKPKGSPGRGCTGGRYGYNLRAALGLTSPAYTWLYGEIKKLCQRYLDMRQTVRYQDARYIAHTYRRILEAFSEFGRYDDPFWPIKDFVLVILRASNNTFKGMLKRTELAQAELEAQQAAATAAEELAAEQAAAAAAAAEEDFDDVINEVSVLSISREDLEFESSNNHPNPAAAPASAPLSSRSPTQVPTPAVNVWSGTTQPPAPNVTTMAPTPTSTSSSVAPAPAAAQVGQVPAPRPRGRPRKSPTPFPLAAAPSITVVPTPAATVIPPSVHVPASTPILAASPASTTAANPVPAADAAPAAVLSPVPAPRVRPRPIAPRDPGFNDDTTRAPTSDLLVNALSTPTSNGKSPSPPAARASSSNTREQPEPVDEDILPGYSSDLSELSVTPSNRPVESEDEEASQPVVKGKGKAKGKATQNGKKQPPKHNPAKQPAVNRKVLPPVQVIQRKSTRDSKPVTRYH